MAESEIIKILNEQLSAVLVPNISDEELHKRITCIINDLIENDFKKLVYILYKVDVSEVKLKLMLRDNPGNAADIIAHLIVERQKEKFESRNLFKPKGEIPDDEKW